MPSKQLVETAIWKDKWFLKLDDKIKLLFMYFLTNESINPAGMYEIDEAYVSFRFKVQDLPKVIKKLHPKVVYDSNNAIVWLVNYYAKNSRGEKMRKSVSNTLVKYKKSPLVSCFLEEYGTEGFSDTLSIDYPMSMDTISIVSNDNDNDNDNDNEKKEKPKITDTDKANSIAELWNQMASQIQGFSKVRIPLTPSRLKATKKALGIIKDPVEWKKIIEQVPNDEFRCGSTGWVADFDWLMRSTKDNHVKLLEESESTEVEQTVFSKGINDPSIWSVDK